MRTFRVAALALIATVSALAWGQDDPGEVYDYFVNFDYRTKLLTPQDLKRLPSEDNFTLADVRGVIFGRHGRIFRDGDIQAWVASLNWYKPNPKFSNSMLNDTERKNLDIVRGAEAKEHKRVEPGDLRFWRDRIIPDSHLKNRTLNDLHIMHAEIQAIHGKQFPEQLSLQKYFNERYWYKAAPHYKPAFNKFEKTNLKKLATAEANIRGTQMGPGALIALKQPLKQSQLAGLTLHELRLLRNEVYAVRGATFETWWLDQHFAAQDWYSPLPEGQKVTLTKADHQNLAVILKQEKKLHDDLARKKFSKKAFAGMRSEDAKKLRSEIYARHGKKFKDPWLQGYFSSLPWYKPNRKYSDRLLSSVERYNVRQLQRYEQQALAREQATEG